MKSSALTFWIVLAVVAAGAYGAYLVWPKNSPRKPSTAPSLASKSGDATATADLTERSGRPFSFDETKGRVWIGSFFFANCPGACWQLNQALKGLQDEITDDELRVISITCDPENDTPEALTKYAQRFPADPARWLFLTGKMDYIKKLGREKFVQVVEPAMHTNRAIVFDRSGKIQGSFDLVDATEVTKLKTKVKALLAEEAPAEEATAEPDSSTTSAEEAAVGRGLAESAM